jgi:hypothetical protein
MPAPTASSVPVRTPSSIPDGPAVTPRSDIAAARSIVKALDTWQLDPIIGFFVPWLGDLVTAAVGTFIVATAARSGMPPIVIARMLLNLGIDVGIGAVPLVGDIGDFAFRANKKNLEILEDRHSRGTKATWKDWLAVAGAAAFCLAAIIGVVWLFVAALRWAF